MVTIKDVARVAKVSPSTVSRVVRGQGKVGKKCRAKVQKVINEMGYIPNLSARALVSGGSALIGVVTPDLYFPFFASVAHGAELAASDANHQIMMRNSKDDPALEREAVNSLREYGCNNIILHSKWADEETLKQYAETIPGFVLINRFSPELATRSVWLDNVAGGRMIADYLYSKGHSNVAIVCTESNNKDQQDRLEGVRQGYKAHGIDIPEDNIIYNHEHLPMDEAYCDKVVKELYQRDIEFSAIIAYNDVQAIRIMNALYDAGKQVPSDVSVVGFDNLNLASMCRPGLTTVEYPVIDMAEYAVKLSLDMTSAEASPLQRTHLFMPKIIERKSVADLSG